MKRLLFIVNPISGGKDKAPLVALLRRCFDASAFSCTFVYTERAGHAVELARDADADAVVAVGGDGTVSEVATGLLGSDKALGIIPCGSGDGLALHLGYSRNVRRAAATLAAFHTVCMDSAALDGHPFFCTAGAGLDAEVAWAFAQSGRRGLANYVLQAWKTWRRFRPMPCTLTVDGRMAFSGDASIVTVGNTAQWGNNALITPSASVLDGELDVTVVRPFRLWDGPALVWRLFRGTAGGSRKTLLLRGREIVLQRGRPGAAHHDGEPCERGARLEFRVQPSSLKVIVPVSAQGRL